MRDTTLCRREPHVYYALKMSGAWLQSGSPRVYGPKKTRAHLTRPRAYDEAGKDVGIKIFRVTVKPRPQRVPIYAASVCHKGDAWTAGDALRKYLEAYGIGKKATVTVALEDMR